MRNVLGTWQPQRHNSQSLLPMPHWVLTASRIEETTTTVGAPGVPERQFRAQPQFLATQPQATMYGLIWYAMRSWVSRPDLLHFVNINCGPARCNTNLNRHQYLQPPLSTWRRRAAPCHMTTAMQTAVATVRTGAPRAYVCTPAVGAGAACGAYELALCCGSGIV